MQVVKMFETTCEEHNDCKCYVGPWFHINEYLKEHPEVILDNVVVIDGTAIHTRLLCIFTDTSVSTNPAPFNHDSKTGDSPMSKPDSYTGDGIDDPIKRERYRNGYGCNSAYDPKTMQYKKFNQDEEVSPFDSQ